jgi:hypothetical protein
MRTDLKVSYAAKDTAKELGGRWEPAKKTRYVDAGVDLLPFHEWLA